MAADRDHPSAFECGALTEASLLGSGERSVRGGLSPDCQESLPENNSFDGVCSTCVVQDPCHILQMALWQVVTVLSNRWIIRFIGYK